MGLEPVRLAIHDLDTDGGGRQPVPQDDAAREAFRERHAYRAATFTGQQRRHLRFGQQVSEMRQGHGVRGELGHRLR